VFGQLWADERLSIRDRRLLLLGAIAALGEDMTFTIQARSALKRGELDREQLNEIVTFLTAYVGYPRGAKLKLAVQTLLAQMEK
jgi:4-carboxymuconolactone decarboxylase